MNCTIDFWSKNAKPAVTYSSQAPESYIDEAPSPTADTRGKQPATRSRGVGVNVAAKNRRRHVDVMTSDVAASRVTSASDEDVSAQPEHCRKQ